MALTLVTYPGNFRAFKALIAAEYAGVEIAVKDVDAKAAAKLSPTGKVPVLETPQGTIFESNAIARYVARLRSDADLYGRTFYESAVVDSWIDFCAHELELPCTLWVYPIIGYMPFSGPAYGKAKAHVSQALKTLDAHLLDKTYMVGEAMTLADITIASALVYPAKLAMDPKFRAQFPNVFRWFDLCVHQPQFVAVIGDVALAESEMKPEGASSAPQGGKKEAKKEKAPKKEKAKKEKAAAPPPAAAPKKVEHPLKILDKKSPSPLNGDEWKWVQVGSSKGWIRGHYLR